MTITNVGEMLKFLFKEIKFTFTSHALRGVLSQLPFLSVPDRFKSENVSLIIAEPKDEASNCVALSSPVYVYINTYVYCKATIVCMSFIYGNYICEVIPGRINFYHTILVPLIQSALSLITYHLSYLYWVTH